MPCHHVPQTFHPLLTNLFLKWSLHINHLPSSSVHSLVIPLHLALWLQQQRQSGSGLSDEGLISFSLIWVGFQPSAPTMFPTVSSHKGGARVCRFFFWCTYSWSVSGSWVHFRVWNYLSHLLANSPANLFVRKYLCVQASCPCPHQETAWPEVIIRTFSQKGLWPKALQFLWLAL